MTMKLFDSLLSPYAGRVRLAIYAKGLEVEFIMPQSEEAATLPSHTPIAKLPTMLHDGHVLPESEVINEYLEDIGTEPSLRPGDPVLCARMRLLTRICDLYVMHPMGELFGQISPVDRDQVKVDEQLVELAKGMSWLEHYLDGSPYALDGRLTLADCTLVPALFFYEQIGPMFGIVGPLKKYPHVEAYFKGIHQDTHAARVLKEIDAALQKMMAGG